MKKRNTVLRAGMAMAAALFTVFAVLTIVTNQIQLNKTREETEMLRQRNEQQRITNLSIGQGIGSEEQHIIEIARNKLGLVLPNEVIVVDISH